MVALRILLKLFELLTVLEEVVEDDPVSPDVPLLLTVPEVCIK